MAASRSRSGPRVLALLLACMCLFFHGADARKNLRPVLMPATLSPLVQSTQESAVNERSQAQAQVQPSVVISPGITAESISKSKSEAEAEAESEPESVPESFVFVPGARTGSGSAGSARSRRSSSSGKGSLEMSVFSLLDLNEEMDEDLRMTDEDDEADEHTDTDEDDDEDDEDEDEEEDEDEDEADSLENGLSQLRLDSTGEHGALSAEQIAGGDTNFLESEVTFWGRRRRRRRRRRFVSRRRRRRRRAKITKKPSTATPGTAPLKPIILGIPKEVCEASLGVRYGGPRPNSAFTASSMYDSNHSPKQGRLNYPGTSWCAKTNNNKQWLQVDLGVNKRITKIVTQGRNNYPQWVTKYKVDASMDGITWTPVNGGSELTGNTNQNGWKVNTVNPFSARYVRFKPTTWSGHISMRAGLYGCDDLKGAPGFPGKVGPSGDKGDTGALGEQGPAGDVGPLGPKGDPGPVGKIGPKGKKGELGSPGDPGDKGQPGQKGDKGPPGSVGSDGELGPSGEKGDTGEPGPRGPPGHNGAKGKDGAQGDPGEKGARGPKGNSGTDGKNGFPGDKGLKGPPGPDGLRGARGPTGEKGDLGAPGLNGVDGKDGEKGPSGEKGQQGGPENRDRISELEKVVTSLAVKIRDTSDNLRVEQGAPPLHMATNGREREQAYGQIQQNLENAQGMMGKSATPPREEAQLMGDATHLHTYVVRQRKEEADALQGGVQGSVENLNLLETSTSETEHVPKHAPARSSGEPADSTADTPADPENSSENSEQLKEDTTKL